MKHLKRFILVIFALGIAGIVYYKQPKTEFKGKESQALTSYYNAIKAQKINSKDILLYLDSELQNFEDEKTLFMSNDLSLMLPATMINDLFHCNVSWLVNDIVEVQKGNQSVKFDVENHLVYENNQWNQTNAAVTSLDGELYLAIDFIGEYFGYSYSWDEETNTALLVSPEVEAVSLPAFFDLRDEGRVSDVRDQGTWGTCWAFATLSALESSLMPAQQWQFSVDHLVHHNGFTTDIDSGGDYNMALAYLASWRGPVAEEDDPYGDGVSPDNLSAAVHLQDAVIINEKDFEQIKKLVMNYGAVQTAIYSQQDIQLLGDYYNVENAAYYYPYTMQYNHDIDIIGWDDNYSKENFVTQPEGDGAFICKNSWGSAFGDDGYFYISYYDKNIGIYGIAYTNVESKDNYDKIYQSDLLGWTGSVGYNESRAWFSNVYTAETESQIEAVSFYTTDKETSYDVYVVHEFDSIEDMSRREIIQSGYIADKGFHTVRFKNPQDLMSGEKFAIVVEINTKDSVHPVAIEYNSSEITSSVDISDGESYMSYNGSLWSHIEEASNANACLKVYTNNTVR